MKRNPTIKDVAFEAGVSIGTVDRVLHNRGKVSENKKKAVLKAIEKLNYKPSDIARALAARKKRIKIGVTYPDVEKYFWQEVKKGITKIEKELRPFGVEIICTPSKTYKIEDQINVIEKFFEDGVNGIAFVPLNPSKIAKVIDDISAKGIGFATFISDVPLSKRLFFIGQDDIKSGMLAGKLTELYLKGRGKVVVLRAERDIRCIQQRITGFVEKIEMECPDIDIVGFYDICGYDENNYYKKAYEATIECINKFPQLDAIYITNGLTEWVAKAVKDMNKRGKIIVIGHEYSCDIGNYLEEGIVGATICQNPSDEAYLVIKLLYENISGQELTSNEIIRINPNIIMKENNPCYL